MNRTFNMFIFLTALSTGAHIFASIDVPKEQQFAQAIENLNLDKIIFDLLRKDFNSIKTWINETATIDGVTRTPLQFAMNKYEELQKQLNPKDTDYEQKLAQLKRLESTFLNMIVYHGADTKKLTSQQQRVPFIEILIKKAKLIELGNMLNKAFYEDSELKHQQMTEDIKKKVAEYLNAGGSLSVDDYDLVQSAIEYDNLPILELIIEKTKIDPITYTFNNDTIYPIIEAAKNGAERVMTYLIQKGVNVNVQDAKGQSALLHSAKRVKDLSLTKQVQVKSLNILKALLNADADTKGIEKYITPSTEEKKNYDYNQDVANYYKAYLDEQKKYSEAGQTQDYKEWRKRNSQRTK